MGDLLGDEVEVVAAVVRRGGYRRCESAQVISRIPRRLTQTPRYQARFDEARKRSRVREKILGGYFRSAILEHDVVNVTHCEQG